MAFTIGSFAIRLRSDIPALAKGIERLYADYPLALEEELIDFQIELSSPHSLRRWWRPQVAFSFEGHAPFKPLPRSQAFAMFEWGLNWVVANHAHQFAIVHAATVEKSGKAVMLPGAPGSGKSTLCAALVCRGWRLLSDEMALISLDDGLLWPFPRPISLKNESIDILRTYSQSVVMGDIAHDTAKGAVAHMRAPRHCIDAGRTPARPHLIAFPRYQSGSATQVISLSKGQTLMRLIDNCFNFSVLGPMGFETIADTVDRCACLTIEYQDMEEAIAALEG